LQNIFWLPQLVFMASPLRRSVRLQLIVQLQASIQVLQKIETASKRNKIKCRG
jgi:hypothetical protein